LAAAAASSWPATAPAQRAARLCDAADRIEADRAALCALLVREAGKTLPNALAEVREATDFLRYYAARAAEFEAESEQGADPAAAEDGVPLGPAACISPWNFPLAIFVGQVAAALAAGNPALAKPAEQTPLVAACAVALLHAAGVPPEALQLLPGDGETGARLVADARVKAVLFTGSTEVARQIHRRLARRAVQEGAEIPLIAETGGQNAMIVDSSALPEQVVQDVLRSAFDSAGQRCSALRVLCLQEEIADRTLAMLDGALRELAIGDPARLSTDVGPVIDADARQRLADHVERMRRAGHRVTQLPLPAHCGHGNFFPPTVIEIDAIAQLPGEVFGPVLHVLRFSRDALPRLIDAIHATGYGLTMGVQTRLDETVAAVAAVARVGNLYVNRNMVGAAVGVQPFGGEGLSGTGPKAGGPLILRRLRRERSACPGLPPALAARTRPGTVDGASVAALHAWRGWLRDTGRERLLAFTDACAAASPAGLALDLPGPTGERNTLAFAPRGVVLCAAGDGDALLRQLAAVLATGNRAALTREGLGWLQAGLPAPCAARIDRFGDAAPAIALADAGQAVALREMLAERDGPLMAVVECAGDVPPPLWRLVVERALSVNTAAAGGNAALLAL
ncbi:MAG: L-glutamate gamma-semialdehyde dehydrogenase, partial [Burkholderiaceae bacterium]